MQVTYWERKMTNSAVLSANLLYYKALTKKYIDFCSMWLRTLIFFWGGGEHFATQWTDARSTIWFIRPVQGFVCNAKITIIDFYCQKSRYQTK